MTPNQKLTRTLAGKTVTDVHSSGSAGVTVRFGDGAVMSVQGALAPECASPTPHAPVTMVRESGASLAIELDGGATLRFTLDDPGGSVLVRDAASTVRYAG